MWTCQYDENLANSPFFRAIPKDLILEISRNSLTIAIPRIGSYNPTTIDEELIQSHILTPGASPSIFYTLSDRVVSIKNKTVIIGDSPPIPILFEETFYENGAKYCVFCVEHPLFREGPHCEDAHSPLCLETLPDCIEFLWSQNMGNSLCQIQKLCDDFMETNKGFSFEKLQTQKDLIGELYSHCLQTVLKTRPLGEYHSLEPIKLAVETYMQSCLNLHLTRAINTLTTASDGEFNKILRNLSHIQLKDIQVGPQLTDNIPPAKIELNKINNYNTILDKINCLKATLNQLFDEQHCLTTDQLLPTLAFLILKSRINNWIANVIYITHFRFCSIESCDETSYVLTSLEAALEYIKSGEVTVKWEEPQNPLFRAVANGDVDELGRLLATPTSSREQIYCHPLCDCGRCSGLGTAHDIKSTNESGQNVVVAATLAGKSSIVEFLLATGFRGDSRDYYGRTALHYASMKGFQDITLILINSGCEINTKDNYGNTALYWAVNNGHENCVKALIYTCTNIDINAVNENGDSALHIAVKWSFIEIIQVLLENNANARIKNKHSQTALSLANNCMIQRILEQHCDLREEPRMTQITPIPRTSLCRDHGIKPKTLDQMKKIDLLLKAIENNDLPLTCFYLGFPGRTPSEFNIQSKCHPLCHCEKCDDSIEQNRASEPIGVNVCNVEGFTPLHIAAKMGRTDIVRVLLDCGAVPTLKTYKTLQTPLHLACANQRVSVVKEILKCADCVADMPDYQGNTPLYYACVRNDQKTVEALLDSGTNYEIRNSLLKEVEERCLYTIRRLLRNRLSITDNDIL